MISPNEDMATSPWMWDDFGSYFSSLVGVEAKIAEIQEKKAAYIQAHSDPKS